MIQNLLGCYLYSFFKESLLAFIYLFFSFSTFTGIKADGDQVETLMPGLVICWVVIDLGADISV